MLTFFFYKILPPIFNSSQYCSIIVTRPLISEERMRKLTNVRKELRNLTIAGLLLERILQQPLFAGILVPELRC